MSSAPTPDERAGDLRVLARATQAAPDDDASATNTASPQPGVMGDAPGKRGVRIAPRAAPASNVPASVYVAPPADPSTLAAPPAAPLPPATPGPVVVDDGGKAPFEDSAGTTQKLALAEREAQKPVNHNHGFWGNLGGALKTALISSGEYARSHPATMWQELAPTIAAAGAGFAAGEVDPSLDEKLQKEIDVRDLENKANRSLLIRERNARVRQVNASAAYNEARPAIAQTRANAAALKTQQQALQREIGNRLKEPRAFDPADAYDSDLAARGQAAGVSFDPKSFGDFKNPTTMEVVDPSDPTGTKKTRLVLDRATDTWHPATVDGQGVTTGYVQPVGPDGMTASERKGAEDREQAQINLERQRRVSNELRERGLAVSQGRLNLASESRGDRLSAESRKELGDANKLISEAERWQQAANDIGSRTQYTDPNDGQVKESRKADNQRDLFAARAASLRQQAVQNYGYLLGGDHMTTQQFKGLFPLLGGNWSGEAQRLGVTLDDDSTQGPVTPSPTRRSAPARGAQPSGSTPQSAGRFAGQRMSRANLPAAAQKLGVSPEEAEHILTREGVTIY